METAEIYDLIEQFDFDQLTEQQKSKVMEQVSEEEYRSMRETIVATNAFFENSPLNTEIPPLRSDSKIRVLAHKSIPLYQVAASVAVIIGLFGFFVLQQPTTNEKIVAIHDTVTRHTRDTVYRTIVDTIHHIKEQIVYVSMPQPTIALSDNYHTNCDVALCATDIDKFGQTGSNGAIAHDSMWKNYVARIE